MYISLWENSRGHPDIDSFMQFSTKIDGFEQKYSQGFENSYNSHEQYPLEKFFIFTIYQNYTLALRYSWSPLDSFSPGPHCMITSTHNSKNRTILGLKPIRIANLRTYVLSSD